jgi:hypothetical protein
MKKGSFISSRIILRVFIRKRQIKIIWTLKVIEEIDRIPEIYLKHLKNTTGLYDQGTGWE